MEKTRHFIVDTPVGQLAIYAKHDKTDCAADYCRAPLFSQDPIKGTSG